MDGMGHTINIDKDRKKREVVYAMKFLVLRGVKRISQGLKMNCVYNLK